MQETKLTFIQLSKDQCEYLLELIQDIDSDTEYTKRQRGYTVPKLEKISKDPQNNRLAYQDVDYLLELMDDDTLSETEQIREESRQVILAIQELQNARFAIMQSIEDQRSVRRSKREQREPVSESQVSELAQSVNAKRIK